VVGNQSFSYESGSGNRGVAHRFGEGEEGQAWGSIAFSWQGMAASTGGGQHSIALRLVAVTSHREEGDIVAVGLSKAETLSGLTVILGQIVSLGCMLTDVVGPEENLAQKSFRLK
jgi:hypothetical protein